MVSTLETNGIRMCFLLEMVFTLGANPSKGASGAREGARTYFERETPDGREPLEGRSGFEAAARSRQSSEKSFQSSTAAADIAAKKN